jgi:hypothetical protein
MRTDIGCQTIAVLVLLTGFASTGVVSAGPGEEGEPRHNPLRGWSDVDKVREIRAGRETEPDGSISAAHRTKVFMAGDTIHVSVSLYPRMSGSDVELRFREPGELEAPGPVVWRRSHAVPTDGGFLIFSLSADELGTGAYQAELVTSGRVIAELHIEVRDATPAPR